jgi:hypothetical protein
VHLTATQVEVDAVVRGERAEALGDALQLEGEGMGLFAQGYLLGVVGMVEPVEDVHERGLPRTVLPEEGVHLTATDIEVDAVVRGERAEALGDALQLEGERGALLGQGCDPT